jgi:hypothetical protein
MQTITIGGLSVKQEIITGTVLSSDKHSQTHITGHGGGGSIGTSGGYVAPATITSQSLEKHEFWIRTEDGRERAFVFLGADIPLRLGQSVSVICVATEEGLASQKGKWLSVALVNHSAGTSTRIFNNEAVANTLGLTPPSHAMALFFLGLIVSGMAHTKFFDSSLVSVAGLCLSALGIYRGFKATARHPDRRANIGALIDKATQSAFSAKI